MADSDKKGFLEKHSGKFLWIVGLIGAIIALPQDKIAKKGLPAFKDSVVEFLKIGRDLTIKGWTRAYDWMKEHGRAFVLGMLGTTLFTLAVMAGGIYLHENGYPFGGQVVAVIGAVLLQVLFVLMTLTAGALAKVLMFKLGLIKQFVGGRFTEAKKKELEERHAKYASYLTSTFVLFSAALAPFELFVSWKVLGVTVIMTGLALPAVFAVIHQKKDFGMVIEAVKFVSIGLVILTIVAFLCVELFPKSFGTIRFGTADGWLAKITPSEWIASFIALGLVALLLYSVFTKDVQRRAASFLAFKWLVPISFGFILFLSWKGTIRYEDLTNHPSPSMTGVEGLVNAIKKPFGGATPVVGLEDVHLAPPSEPPQSGVIQKRATAKKPLPPPPQERSYQDDPGSAIADLEALE